MKTETSVALFTIGKTLKATYNPLADEKIKKYGIVVYIDYSAIKKNEVLPFQKHGWT